MNLDFAPSDWNRIRHAYSQWWAGTLQRPLCFLTIKGRDPGRPEPDLPSYDFASFYGLDVSAERIADRMIYDLECRHFLGDSFPLVTPNFGPGVIAAFMGLELENGVDTVWFHPPEGIEMEDIEMKFDAENVWFRRIREIYQAVAARGEGLVQLGMTDLGGNLDILASFRNSQDMLLDLYDVPEIVELKAQQAHDIWWKYFDELNTVIQPAHPGYIAWTPLYSETPYYILQCDFGYMISSEMFNRFALPEIRKTCEKLSNPFFHLDGPGMLKHLDALLEIPELKGVQWIPGAGQPPVTEWPEVYRKIRAAGKLIQFWTTQDPLGWRAIDVLAEQLGSAQGIMMFGEAPAEDEPEIRKMLARHGA